MATKRIVLTTDASGAATGTIPTQVGFLEYIEIDYAAGVAAGADLTVVETSDLQRTFVSLTDNNTDKIIYPVVQATNSAGVDIANEYRRAYVDGGLLVTVAQGGDTKVIAVTAGFS
jgi:hypothetical protein